MALVTAPTLPLRAVTWSFDQPGQANVSAWTGKRTVVTNPWHGKWSAKVDLATQQGEANFARYRGFLAKLKGTTNYFYLPASEGPQYAGSNYALLDAAAQGANQVALGTVGSVLSTNPGQPFTTTTGWTASGATLSVASSNLRVTNSGAAAGKAYQDVSVTIGQTYRVDVGVINGTAPALFSIGDTGGTGSEYFSGSAGPVYFTPTTSSVRLTMVANSTTSGQYADLGYGYIRLLTPTPVVAGHFLTFPLPSGNKQMVVLTDDPSATNGLCTFMPTLREAVAASTTIESVSPYAQVALTDSSFSWDVGSWRRYGLSFACDEAF